MAEQIGKTIYTSAAAAAGQQRRWEQDQGMPSGIPKMFDDKRVTGLLDTFNTLMEKAQGSKKARSAQIYSGLANVVSGMIGEARAEKGQEITAGTAARGQEITAQAQAEEHERGLSRIALEAAGLSETSQYHKGMLDKMAAEMGLDVQKFEQRKTEFEARTGLEERRLGREEERLGLEERKVDIAEKATGLAGMQGELRGTSGVYETQKAKLLAGGGALGKKRTLGSYLPFAEEAYKPTATQTQLESLEAGKQGALGAIYKRYGVGETMPTTTSSEEEWQKILRRK